MDSPPAEQRGRGLSDAAHRVADGALLPVCHVRGDSGLPVGAPRTMADAGRALLPCGRGVQGNDRGRADRHPVVRPRFLFGSFGEAFRTRWRFYAALSASWLVIAALLATSGQSASAWYETAHVSARDYFLNQPDMLLRYFWLAVWPRALVLYYGWPVHVALGDVWISLAVVGVLFCLDHPPPAASAQGLSRVLDLFTARAHIEFRAHRDGGGRRASYVSAPCRCRDDGGFRRCHPRGAHRQRETPSCAIRDLHFSDRVSALDENAGEKSRVRVRGELPVP